MEVRSVRWGSYLAICAAGMVAFYLAPGRVSAVLYDLFGFAAAVSLFVGARSRPLPERRPWYLLSLGMVGWVVGDTFWTTYQLIGRTAPFPSYADVLYLIAYPLWIVGLLLLARRGREGSDPTVMLDAIILMISGGIASWLLVIAPSLGTSPRSTFAVAVTVAYPVMDVLLLGALIRLLLTPTRERFAYGLLATGLVVVLIADTAYSIAILNGSYTNQSWMDLGWLVFYAAWGAAGLRPRSSPDPRPVAVGRPQWISLISFAVAGVTLPVAALVVGLRNDHGGTMLVVGATIIAAGAIGIRLGISMRRTEGDRHRLDVQRGLLEGALADLHRAQGERTELLDRTLRATEDERARFAVELHDGPIQHLAAVSLRIGLARTRLQADQIPAADEALAKTELDLSNDIGELRRLMSDLRPPALDEGGLEGALRDHCDTVARRIGADVRVEYERGPLPHDTAIVLYRIAQEALSNVARHANANEIDVRVVAGEDHTSLVVRDDGTGFDASDDGAFTRDGYFGLAGMAQRASLVGGTLHVESQPRGGTTVSVLVPVSVTV